MIRSPQGASQLVVQARLSVGSVDDPSEVEADRVAATVMRSISRVGGLEPPPPIRDDGGLVARLPAAPGRIREATWPRLQRSASLAGRVQPSLSEAVAPEVGAEGGDLGSETAAAISRATGHGDRLPPVVQRTMEGAFGADFSAVRIHADGGADRLATRIQAKAFTTGSDVFFRAGQFDPTSRTGQEVLAHELTHVVQQGGAKRGDPAVGRRLDESSDGPVGQRAPSSDRSVIRRLRSKEQWVIDSDIAIGRFRRDRTDELQALDDAVGAYDKEAQLRDRKAQLQAIFRAVDVWKAAKGGPGEASKAARNKHIQELHQEVTEEYELVTAQYEAERLPDTPEIATAKIREIAPHLLDDLPPEPGARAEELFDRFMARFRGNVSYTLQSTGKFWNGGAGPFACASIATGLQDLALSAGLNAMQVKVTRRNFVTPIFRDAFIDTQAAGNVQDDTGRVKRYFFTEHYITQIGDRFYCPTSGLRLSGREAPELYDAEFGQLDGDAKGYEGPKARVQPIGAENGGSLYLLTRKPDGG